jgi:hypothetical protein
LRNLVLWIRPDYDKGGNKLEVLLAGRLAVGREQINLGVAGWKAGINWEQINLRVVGSRAGVNWEQINLGAVGSRAGVNWEQINLGAVGSRAGINSVYWMLGPGKATSERGKVWTY